MFLFYLILITLLFNIYYKTKTLYNCPYKMKINSSKFIQYIFSVSLIQYIIMSITNNFLIHIVFPEYKDAKLLQLFKDLRTYILLSFITTISCFIKAEFTIFKKDAKK